MTQSTSFLSENYFEPIVKELKKGEESEKIENFDWKKHLEELYAKYVK